MAEVITSRTNPRIKQLRAAFANQARLASGLIAIEGQHLLEEALSTNQAIKTIFLSERTPAPANLPRDIEVLRLAQDVFQSCTDTQTPQGIAALLVPPTTPVRTMLTGNALILVAVGLQDPGNLGTLIRSALAFGATGVLTTAGTVSPWNGKAIRASAGTVFRMPLAIADDETLALLRANDVALYASIKSGPGTASDVESLDLDRPCALLVGNEGAGLPADWLALADARVSIATPGPVESLNAAIAGSLLLYEASRQRTGFTWRR